MKLRINTVPDRREIDDLPRCNGNGSKSDLFGAKKGASARHGFGGRPFGFGRWSWDLHLRKKFFLWRHCLLLRLWRGHGRHGYGYGGHLEEVAYGRDSAHFVVHVTPAFDVAAKKRVGLLFRPVPHTAEIDVLTWIDPLIGESVDENAKAVKDFVHS